MTATSMSAQKLLTLEELNFGGKNYAKFVPQRFKYEWSSEGHILIDKNNGQERYLNPATGKETSAVITEHALSPVEGAIDSNVLSGAVMSSVLTKVHSGAMTVSFLRFIAWTSQW